MRWEPVEINLLARGASNAKWHSGCLAPDRCVESICDWLIRGPLFFARTQLRTTDNLVCLSSVLANTPMTDKIVCPTGGSNQVSAHCPNGRLCAVRNADFSQNVLHVLFHRLVADAQ